MLADGKRFLFSAITGGNTGRVDLRMGSMDGPDTRSLGTIAGNAVLGGPGLLLFRRAETLYAQPVNKRTMSFEGEPVPVVNGIRYYAVNGFGAFSASDTGLLIFRRGGNTKTHLRWFDRRGKPLGDIGPPGPYWSFDISRDETRIAVVRDDPVLGIGQLWTGDSVRGALTRLNSDSAWEPAAAWSPDGRRLAYARRSAASFSLVVRDSTGKENERLTLEPSEYARGIEWTPDSRFLAVATTKRPGSSRILLVAVEGANQPTEIINGANVNLMPQFSADGRWIAYVSSDAGGRPEIYVRPFPEVRRDKWAVSEGGGVQPRWSADGREIFYIDPLNHIVAVPVQAKGDMFRAGNPVRLFQANVPWTPATRYEYAVSRDGQRFLACVLAEEDDRNIEMLIHWDSILRPR
jgi:dipeptidyl aminopeptidase/acylaminoacyl peptidase